VEELPEVDSEKLKELSLELIDIGLFYGQKGINTVKSLPLYERIDRVVNFDDKFALVRDHGEQLYTKIDSKFKPLVHKAIFLYDSAQNRVVTFLGII